MSSLFGGLVEGSPEERAAARQVADECRKLERRRSARVSVALEEYEEACQAPDGPSARQCMDFSIEVKRADDDFQTGMGRAAQEVFEQATGTTVTEIRSKLAQKIEDLGITGFAMGPDGDVLPMGADGVMDELEPDELLDLVEPLVALPGFLPPEVKDSLFARCEEIRRERGEAPAADSSMDFLEGIDLENEAEPKRDFDGGLE